MQSVYMAVSYTHLDVYKRQALQATQLSQLKIHHSLLMILRLQKLLLHRSSSLRTVSYTHLDVYKRQGRILSNFTDITDLKDFTNKKTFVRAYFNVIGTGSTTVDPVSYTHLDVYKRQLLFTSLAPASFFKYTGGKEQEQSRNT